MIEAGRYHDLKVVKTVDFGLYLDAAGTELLLPKRFVPDGAKEGDTLTVFVYHDSENRLIATTQRPKAVVGEIAAMEVVSITNQGAFLDWGLMKDLFIPLSQQLSKMYTGSRYLVMPYIDQQTGRVAATERFEHLLQNETLTVKENDPVRMLIWRKTDIGYVVIINNQHTGVLHFDDIFRTPDYGECLDGFIKTIREDNKLDVKAGERGYQRVLSEQETILRLLQEHNGYLPYNDKSAPEKIYAFFGISKKTFKMAIGALYRERKIDFVKEGILLLPADG